jgi:hypothetical protein
VDAGKNPYPTREEKPEFCSRDGQQVTGSVGFAIICDRYFTIDEVVSAKPEDLQLLGARTFEGLNLVIDPGRKKLVAAGPVPAVSSMISR